MSTDVPDVNFLSRNTGRTCLCNSRVRSRSPLRIAVNAASAANVKAVRRPDTSPCRGTEAGQVALGDVPRSLRVPLVGVPILAARYVL